MFTFTPLQGARSDSAAVQSILELDGGVKVLVDVGWDETFDPQKLKELEKYVGPISSPCCHSMLINPQTGPDLVPRPAHPCHDITSRRICALLQAPPSIHAHSGIRHDSRHSSGSDVITRIIRFDTTRRDHNTPGFAQ